MRIRKMALTSVCLCMSLLASDQALANPTTQPYTRLSGPTRFETAKTIAEELKSGEVQQVVLATGNGFADALSATVLAHELDAPILLTNSTVARSQCTFDYISQHLTPEGTIYIIGGTGVISEDFDTTLKSLGYENIIRLAGNDKYGTSYELARSLHGSSNPSSSGTPISTVVISPGGSYPDALSMASFAANMGWPILLSPQNALTNEVRDYLIETNPSKVYLTGGTSILSDKVQSEIIRLLPQANVERLTGGSRFETNITIAETFAPDPQTVYLASGNGFADALSGSVLAASEGDPILFIDPNIPTLPKATANYFAKLYANGSCPNLISLGGNGTVPDKTISLCQAILHGTQKETDIYSIKDITVTVGHRASYALPTTVPAKLYNSETKNVPVSWSPSTVTKQSGISVYQGVVEGYNKPVHLKVIRQLSDIAITGRSAILMDVDTGATLFSKNPTKQEYPASLTKLMTALIVYNSELPLTKHITVGDSVRDDDLSGTTLMGLKQGDTIPLGDLLSATLVGSVNDGANAIAQATAGSVSSFVDRMNLEAKALGMKNTHFANPSGLTHPDHYTTAEDLAILSQHIVKKYPQILDITAKKSVNVTVNGHQRTIQNINRLIQWDPSILGLKTGYTRAADNTIIGLQRKGDRTVIAVILKSPGHALYSDAYKLLQAGVDF